MKKLARQISTQNWIPDFQDRATDEGLYLNAERLGFVRSDVEIVEVDDVTFAQVVETETAETRLLAEQGAQAEYNTLRTQARTLMQKLGLTKPEMKVLLRIIKRLSEDDIDAIT
jgi:hypothetical protein